MHGWHDEEGFQKHMEIYNKTNKWFSALLRHCRMYMIITFSKFNSLVSNLTRLTSEFVGGQQQSKQRLKFVFRSTQTLLAAAIKCRQMHLQTKTRLPRL